MIAIARKHALLVVYAKVRMDGRSNEREGTKVLRSDADKFQWIL